MKLFWLGLMCLFPMLGHAEGDTLRLGLDDCIAMARRQSVDAAVALVMALDRALRNEQQRTESVYEHRGMIVL